MPDDQYTQNNKRDNQLLDTKSQSFLSFFWTDIRDANFLILFPRLRGKVQIRQISYVNRHAFLFGGNRHFFREGGIVCFLVEDAHVNPV